MRQLILLFLLLLSFHALANKLIVVQAISNSKKTFVVRLGRKDGVYPGSKGTFTGENVSIIAKAVTVTREFSQWKVDNNEAVVPFVKDEIITYHSTAEYLWTLMPMSTRKKFLKEIVVEPRKAFILRGALMTGLKQSVSGVEASSVERGGYIAEGIYEIELDLKFVLGLGIRAEQEIVQVSSSSLTTSRYLGIAEINVYNEPMEDFYNARFFYGLSIGYGFSTTADESTSASGAAWLLPAARMGLLMPINKQYGFIFEAGLETISAEEGSSTANTQTTDGSNLRYGIGIRRYFSQ